MSRGEISPFTDEEKREFKHLLRSDLKIRRLYRDFKSEEGQALRQRFGQFPWVDKNLDILFEIAMVSGI
jgi:hypothetical protein